MPEWVVAMFMIGLVLVVRDMAKTVFEARRSRREVAVYDNHPQKVRMERYADSFQSLADTFYRMPRKREVADVDTDHIAALDRKRVVEQVEQILDGQREKLCERCPKASWCWEQYYHLTTQQCMEILEAFASGDEQQQDLAKSDWISHCLSGARFLELLYTEYAKVRQNMIWNNKLIENRLAVAEQLLGGRGACRVHGGGFAGTIQAFVPLDMLDEFKTGIERIIGEGRCHVLSIRPEGGAVL